jgi:hypothetical protein
LESLELRKLRVGIDAVSPRNVVGIVTTPDFENGNEADRQEFVWEKLYQELTKDERSRVEFVCTNTPEEEAEMDDCPIDAKTD